MIADGRTDRQTLPSTLSPRFTVDKNFPNNALFYCNVTRKWFHRRSCQVKDASGRIGMFWIGFEWNISEQNIKRLDELIQTAIFTDENTSNLQIRVSMLGIKLTPATLKPMTVGKNCRKPFFIYFLSFWSPKLGYLTLWQIENSGQTDGRTERRYQVHYLPSSLSYAVNKKVFWPVLAWHGSVVLCREMSQMLSVMG